MKTDKKMIVSQYCLDRRRFLAVAGGVTLIRHISFADTGNPPELTRWAFASDTHVPTTDKSDNPPRGHYFFDPLGNTRRTMAAIAADAPVGVVITGDLARLTGQVGDYKNVADCLAALPKKCPVFQALGNHDHRANFRQVFKKTPGIHPAVEKRYITVIDTPPVRFILLDSLRRVNEGNGELGLSQRMWLKDFLATHDDTPTLIFLHHNLSPKGGAIADALLFFEIIRPIRSVKAVVFGHSHVYRYAALDDIHLINLPAVGYSFNEKVPVGWVEAKLTSDGGRFKLNVIDGPSPANRIRELTWRQ